MSGTKPQRLAWLPVFPTWLATLPASDCVELKSLIKAYIQAMHRSHEQLETTLAPRDAFTRQHLQARLRKDFSLKGDFDVQLDLPDSVTLEKQLADGAAPGTPQKLVAVPSTTRSKMSLEELAQLNIDNTPVDAAGASFTATGLHAGGGHDGGRQRTPDPDEPASPMPTCARPAGAGSAQGLRTADP